MWQWAWEYRYLFQIMILFPLDIYLEAGLLYRVAVLFSISCTLPHCFPLWLCQCTCPPTAHKASPFSTSSSVALVAKNSPANAGDIKRGRLDPWSGRCPGERNGNPLQYSGLENPLGRGAWWATVHRVAKSWTRLKWLSTHSWSSPTWRSQKSLAFGVKAFTAPPLCWKISESARFFQAA